MTTLEALAIRPVPIHGDAGLHNVFITPDGAVIADLEDACIGPREWDLGWVRDPYLTPFEPVDRRALSVLRDLRSLCVSIWCWEKSEVPEKQAS